VFNLLLKKNCFVKEKLEKKESILKGGCIDAKRKRLKRRIGAQAKSHANKIKKDHGLCL